MPWVGRHVGTPCLLMKAWSSTSPAVVELAGCRVPFQLCPWEVGLGAVGLSQGKELSSLGGVSDCQPSKGHCRWMMGTRGQSSALSPSTCSPEVSIQDREPCPHPRPKGALVRRCDHHCAHQEGLSLTTLRAGRGVGC